MSGYVDNAKFRREIEDRGATIVEKPFFPDVLVQKIREVLEQ
jgi:hypothetical protein